MRLQEKIKQKYPHRISNDFYTITQFGGHKDTTYEDVVEILKGEPVLPPEERKIRFREFL